MGSIQRGPQTQDQVAEVSPEGAFQDTGTVGVAQTPIAFPSVSSSVLVLNRHATETLFVHLKDESGAFNSDGTPIDPGGFFEPRYRGDGIELSASAASTNYHVTATLENL